MQDIIRAYEQALQHVDALQTMPHAAFVDHLPEFLNALATWVEARSERSDRGPLSILAEGHALQRLGFGITLETLTHEYAVLRDVLLAEMLNVPSHAEGLRDDLIALNLGLDVAVLESIKRYSARRDALRERFIGILGHDLRNPLATVSMGAAALIESHAAGSRPHSIGVRIATSADRMARMISDVLDFARGHLGGGIPAVPVHQDMGKLCATAVDEIKAAWPERDIQLRTEGDLRGGFDPDRVVQALVNMLSNAVAHGDDPIVVRAWEHEDRRGISTCVSNHGPRIPADLMPRLFDPFHGGAGTQRNGLGLGLYIVQQIALAHGATCSVTSDDETTAFTIRWPRVSLDEYAGRSR